MTDVFEKYEFTGRLSEIYRDALARVRPNRDRESTKTGFPDDGKTPFEDAFERYPDEPYIVCLAHGIVDSWLVSEPVIFPHDMIVGFTRPDRPVFEHFSWGVKIEKETERTARLRSRMVPRDEEPMHEEGRRRFGDPKAYGYVSEILWWAGGYQGHTIPSYPKLLTMGLDGVRAQIDEYDAKADPADREKKDFYRACRIIINGLSDWLLLYADLARDTAAKTDDPVRREELLENERVCRKVSRERPGTCLEAAQLMWAFCLWDWADCVGRFDQYMSPFCKSDADLDVITALFMKLWEHGIHNMTIGGVIPDSGEDAANAVTYHVLRVMRTMHETHPRISLRVHDGTPDDLLRLAVLMWSEGMSDPTVANDGRIIPGLEGYGIPPRDAKDFSILGCQEIEIPGKSNFGCNDGSFNLAKVLEYTLFNGFDKTVNYRCVPDLGRLTDYKTFDDLWNAFVGELGFLIPIFLDLCNMGVELRVRNAAKLVKSTMTEACVERGKLHDDGGTVYNLGAVNTAGHAATGDSLYALKKLCYDEKKLSLGEVYEALAVNFEGHEDVRRTLLSAPKYGNGDRDADEMTARVLRTFWSEIGKYRSRRGDVFTGCCVLLGSGIEYGKKTWALPDGRRAGEPLGNTVGPRTGSDKNGLTAMLTSVTRMPFELGCGGATANVLIPTYMMNTEELRQKIVGLIRTFFAEGGQQAQITTAPLEDMKDAQLHPERHGDLIVRLGGFSMKFVEFDRETQDEFIMRYSCYSQVS